MFDKPTRFTTEQKVLLKTVEELRQIELEKSFSLLPMFQRTLMFSIEIEI